MVYNTVYFGRQLRTPIYQITWHHIPEDSNIHNYHHENLKSHMQCQIKRDDNYEWWLGRNVTDQTFRV